MPLSDDDATSKNNKSIVCHLPQCYRISHTNLLQCN